MLPLGDIRKYNIHFRCYAQMIKPPFTIV
uniref:Uncharacterized protein n=1 Tax=Anguilla anguilla TaxID=7936 RepID=A0A0E9P5X9_ANGAN